MLNNRERFAKMGCWASVDWGCVLKVTGEDAFAFLQGQFSQDLRAVRGGEAVYGFWLTRTGRLQGDAWVVAEADESFTVLSRGLVAGALRSRLEHHIIADDVSLEDETPRWSATWWVGELAMERFHREAAEGRETGEGWWLREGIELPGGSGFRVAKAGAAEVVPDLEAVSAVGLHRLRVQAGVPWVPEDVGPGELPQEGGVGLVAAGVSFSKGCYLGQEVMARVRSTGRVRRRIVKVWGDGEVPRDGANCLWQDGCEIGALRSRVPTGEDGWAGLALVGAALNGQESGVLRLEQEGPSVFWEG